jgi:hypothetical protein
MTIHEAQGGTWDQVFVLDDERLYREARANRHGQTSSARTGARSSSSTWPTFSCLSDAPVVSRLCSEFQFIDQGRRLRRRLAATASACGPAVRPGGVGIVQVQ